MASRGTLTCFCWPCVGTYVMPAVRVLNHSQVCVLGRGQCCADKEVKVHRCLRYKRRNRGEVELLSEILTDVTRRRVSETVA
jgi:hypothetical protein